MTRDEERRVDDLPEERGTMSAREAVLEALDDACSYLEGTPLVWMSPAEWRAVGEKFEQHLRALGFQVLPSIPSPR
jgi:hypothetical protein